MQAAIQEVKEAVNSGKTVYFHCAGGRNRTGTVATGVLLELGLATTVEEAEAGQRKTSRYQYQARNA